MNASMFVDMQFGMRQPYDKYHPHRYVEVDLLALHLVAGVRVNTKTGNTFTAQVYTSREGIGWNSLTDTAVTYNSGDTIPVNKKASHIRYIPCFSI